MNARTYQVIFDGVRPGVSATDARNRLAAHYKVLPERIDALLSRPDRVLWKGLAFNVADQHRKAAESAGIICRLMPEGLPAAKFGGFDPARRAADNGTIAPQDGPSRASLLAGESRAPSTADPSHGADAKATARVAFAFTGRPGEYFRIWIVNACLSVISLGIYSAWAKVRRRQYFYGNTLLQNSAFEYLADPQAILKGRVIVFVAFVLYSISKEIHWLLGFSLFLAFLGFLPWLVNRALSFNARNSAHRNVRFGFQAGYRETMLFLAIPVFLLVLTLGLIYPYYVYRKKRFFLEHSSYGTTPFAFTATPRAYYQVYMKVALMFLLFLAGSVATVGIGAIPLYLLFAAHRDGAVARLTWSGTSIADMQFECGWTTSGLFRLYCANTVGIIVSLGLLAPWAAVRTARYQLEHLVLTTSDELDHFAGAIQKQIPATGDEAAEFLGFDFGL